MIFHLAPRWLGIESGTALFCVPEATFLTLRKLLTHRLAVAGTATSVFSPADVPSAAKRFVALSF